MSSGIGVRNTSTLDRNHLTPAYSPFTSPPLSNDLAFKRPGTHEACMRSTLSSFGLHQAPHAFLLRECAGRNNPKYR